MTVLTALEIHGQILHFANEGKNCLFSPDVVEDFINIIWSVGPSFQDNLDDFCKANSLEYSRTPSRIIFKKKSVD